MKRRKTSGEHSLSISGSAGSFRLTIEFRNADILAHFAAAMRVAAKSSPAKEELLNIAKAAESMHPQVRQ